MRFFLIDRITKLEIGKSVSAIKCWSLDNEIFQDHFPGYPTVPGVLLTETMAQALGLLIEKSYYSEFKNVTKVYPILSIVQKAKFRKFVRPGDQCIVEGSLLTLDLSRGTGEAKTFVNNELVAEATLSFLIGTEKDLGNNAYIAKLNQYHESILADIK
jgi:3-hydroxymyristoyl/3-hydroxydecanoyl-(acyl carrier protein) dehydratase